MFGSRAALYLSVQGWAILARVSVKGLSSTPSIDNSDTRPSSFAALRHRDFRLLWAGQFISLTGSQMQLVAINWHVYLLTKSSVALGLVGLVRVVPIVLCSLMGGVVADAFDRKRLMVEEVRVLRELTRQVLDRLTSA